MEYNRKLSQSGKVILPQIDFYDVPDNGSARKP